MVQKYILSALILFSVMIAGSLAAQLNPNKLTHYGELDGNIIYDVMPDRMGYIWMATQSGLVLFDGYEYRRFHPDQNDSTTIGSILTYKLFENTDGKIFIGCLDYIYIYNPLTKLFKAYNYSHLTDFPSYAQQGVATITSDGKGKIYLGISSLIGEAGSSAIVYYDELDDQVKRIERPDSLEIKNTYSSTADPSGNLWFTSYNGLFKIDTQKKVQEVSYLFHLKSDEDEFPYQVESDAYGTIWMVTTKERLIAYDPERDKLKSWSMGHIFKENFEDFFVSDLEFDSTNILWIGSDRGLVNFNPENERFETFGKSTGVETRPYINCIQFDDFGNLWFGTRSNGLLKYSNRAILGSYVNRINDKTSIGAGWVNRIIESNDGSIWLASSHDYATSGISKLDPLTGHLIPYMYESLTPGIRWYYVIGELVPGKILAESSKGTIVFDTKTLEVNITSLGKFADTTSINNFYTDKRSNTWYCATSGLYVKEKDKKTIRYFNLYDFGGTSEASNAVVNVWESDRYGLWLQTNDGLYLYDYAGDTIIRHAFNPEKGDALSSQDINSFYEDKQGILWVGTWAGGLCRYDPESGIIKTYSMNDGLANMSIQGILADEKNNALWLSTFNGISRFNIEDEQFNNFSLADGMQGLLYADDAYLRTSGGLFIFGGSNGITIFNPDDINKNAIPPKVYITDFKIANQSMPKEAREIINNHGKRDGRIELSHDQNNISLEYVGIQYDNPLQNKFSYILENYDNSWREVDNQRTAFYYNLPPGNYTFKVIAANSNGVWNDEGTSIKIIISPPWWKTWWVYIIYGVLFIGLIFSFDRIQRKRLVEKQRSLAKEKELKQAREIEKAYNKLKTTQSQLLHAEKMASLGELTAGIAHEIQNPLNFVKNFSEVNIELIEELKEEIKNGDLDEIDAIANDIADNEQKISYHGSRADAIVKGMLQHSRTNSGEKQPTDINAIADEYLRMAYHGLRAKDSTFNSDFKTDFDKTLPKINAIPQDIGRVLINLINNAFYSVSKRAKEGQPGYEPAVVVSTKAIDGHVEIRVSDNGGGIPQDILDKIFQPFFTTKPTGEGTGLGLSLSYDIITKGHGGKLNVKTEEEIGTEFIIILPV